MTYDVTNWSAKEEAVRRHIETIPDLSEREAFFDAACAKCAVNGYRCHANAHPFSGGCFPELFAVIPRATVTPPPVAHPALSLSADTPTADRDAGDRPECDGCPYGVPVADPDNAVGEYTITRECVAETCPECAS